MNDIFRDLLDIYCMVYLDDILIYSETSDDHIKHVKTVLKRLQENDLFAKLEKCEFSTKTVNFLGYVVSDQGIGMEPSRIRAISDWPVPSNVRELQSFLGFANF